MALLPCLHIEQPNPADIWKSQIKRSNSSRRSGGPTELLSKAGGMKKSAETKNLATFLAFSQFHGDTSE